MTAMRSVDMRRLIGLLIVGGLLFWSSQPGGWAAGAAADENSTRKRLETLERQWKAAERSLVQAIDRIALLEDKLDCLTHVESGEINGLQGPHLIIEGCNVHIRNSAGATDTTNGVGNLIVGYNEEASSGRGTRTGSHNLILGPRHVYPSYGGFVGGVGNDISGEYVTVAGGSANSATGYAAVVGGGTTNLADGPLAAVSGGGQNRASGQASVVSGGLNNLSTGFHASVAGGDVNVASGSRAVVSGGQFNEASGLASSVSGGSANLSEGSFSTVSGGEDNVAAGESATASGGIGQTAAAVGAHVP